MKPYYRYMIDPEAGLVYGVKGRPIGARNKDGYLVIVARDGFRGSTHRMVWEVVNGPIPAGLEINHRNGVKADNRIANLELMTRGDNVRHAWATGLAKARYGETHHSAKLTAAQVAAIRASGLSQTALAKIHGVAQCHISRIRRSTQWRRLLPAATGAQK